MQDCVVTLKGKEYTLEEFKNLVMEKGLGEIFDDLSEAAPQIADKYDFLDEEDSLMEMWAKLEAQKLGIKYLGTEEQVNSLLQPKGQLTDFSTQEQIRYNTYSGISLTGIAANFGKMLGYLFETYPIQSIRDRDTDEEIFNSQEKIVELLNQYEVNSIEELLDKSSRFEVASRMPAIIDPSSWFRINGVLIDRFSRTEVKLFDKQKITNIFETIDTIINLAIDNVKEQKLHILGITNASANSFLNMIGMGVPLHVVSKIFKSPSIMALAEHGRYTETRIRQNVIKPALDILEKYTEEQIEEIEAKYQSKSKVVKRSLGNNYSTGVDIPMELVDKVYLGEASELEKAYLDDILGNVLLKMLPLNDTAFDYAKIFSSLRSFPTKKWQLDSMIEAIEKYVKFEEEQGRDKKRLEQYMEAIKQNFRDVSPTYKSILETKGVDAAENYLEEEIKVAQKSPSLDGELKRALGAARVSALIRKGKRVKSTSNNGPFGKSSPLSLPHVFEAYVAMLQLRTVLERLFSIHSPVVGNFVRKIMDEAGVFTLFDKMEKSDNAKKDLIRYLSSGLKFKVWDTEIDLNVSQNETTIVDGRIISGVEAWAQKLITRIGEIEPDQDNMFLASIEPDMIPETSLKTLRILSDKVSDEELLERIREDFVIFAKANPELAADLFKFNLLSNAMYYEKTGFSLIFPDSWAAAFSNALTDRIQSVLPVGKTLTQFNLEMLADDFLFQYVRNNPELISFSREAKAVPTTHFKKYDKDSERGTPFYGGITDDGVHFDLRMNAISEPRKFVRQYGSDVYMFISSDGEHDHYVKITESAGHKLYGFDPYQIENSLDLDKLKSMFLKGKVVNSSRIHNGVYRSEHTADKLEEGQIIYTSDKSAVHITKLDRYVVEKDRGKESVGGLKINVYKIRYLDSVDVTKGEDVKKVKERLSLFINEQLGAVRTIKDVMEVKDLVTRKSDHILISNQPLEDGIPHYELPIPRWEERPSSTEIRKALDKIYRALEKLPTTNTYFLKDDLLQPLERYESVRKKVAEAIYDKFGYVFPNTSVDKDSSKTKEMLMVNAAIKRQELEVIGLKNRVFQAAGDEPVHLATTSGLGKKTKAAITEGSVVYLGIHNGEGVYGFVRDVNGDQLRVTVFAEEFFLNNLSYNIYPPEVFDALYNEYLTNKC